MAAGPRPLTAEPYYCCEDHGTFTDLGWTQRGEIVLTRTIEGRRITMISPRPGSSSRAWRLLCQCCEVWHNAMGLQNPVFRWRGGSIRCNNKCGPAPDLLYDETELQRWIYAPVLMHKNTRAQVLHCIVHVKGDGPYFEDYAHRYIRPNQRTLERNPGVDFPERDMIECHALAQEWKEDRARHIAAWRDSPGAPSKPGSQ